MKQLVRKPFFLAMLLTIPLWIVFSNFVVAIMVALFSAFLVSMCHSLYVVNRANKKQPPTDLPPTDETL
ncbi:hypothetical protein EKL30_06690 [Candidimonas sp. SYP-B2681]|uniref:hypothetical protein n=1 Tax=Candidimonas sp. SYP-B2681 TaxID=2497686 RepID=UPI000F887E5A|nr:hypothetical protein [Candidimonas sp. SYP-B2681]RTZ45695.1 hypothetical protein EKL30_06690 [Candidimonas sp. SYP-B2681]